MDRVHKRADWECESVCQAENPHSAQRGKGGASQAQAGWDIFPGLRLWAGPWAIRKERTDFDWHWSILFSLCPAECWPDLVAGGVPDWKQTKAQNHKAKLGLGAKFQHAKGHRCLMSIQACVRITRGRSAGAVGTAGVSRAHRRWWLWSEGGRWSCYKMKFGAK